MSADYEAAIGRLRAAYLIDAVDVRGRDAAIASARGELERLRAATPGDPAVEARRDRVRHVICDIIADGGIVRLDDDAIDALIAAARW